MIVLQLITAFFAPQAIKGCDLYQTWCGRAMILGFATLSPEIGGLRLKVVETAARVDGVLRASRP